MVWSQLERLRPIFENIDATPIHSFADTINPFQLALDVVLLVFVLYVLNRKSYKPEKPLSKEEIEQLIAEWEPVPLHPKLTPEQELDSKTPVITGTTPTHVTIDGIEGEVLHLARTNFLGTIGHPKVEESARNAVYKYGTGTCGPRGFYGTIDVHLELEERIKNFMRSEDAIIYSYGFATVSSAIPSFSGRGDILVVDKGVSYALQTGIKLSRSDVFWFEHNDMADLERVLKEIKDTDRRTKRKLTRRFIVIEGLYPSYGDITPLNEIMKLKEQYCYRIIMDESFSIGTLGKTGRGVTEHFNVPVRSVEIITGDLASTVGSVGGFCLGSTAIIYHQRLNGPGYVYSASLPALLTRAATTGFDMLDEQPQLVDRLRNNTAALHKGLSAIDGMRVVSWAQSPVVLLTLDESTGTRLGDETLLQAIVDKALESKVLLTRAKFVAVQEKFLAPPAIRIFSSAVFTDEHIRTALKVIKAAADEVLPKRDASQKKQKSRRQSSVTETAKEAEEFLSSSKTTGERKRRSTRKD
eukprot:TRINITY_DN6097_c0_g1_i1.p1 TRINITY_DN6097_c0_g1~~TRINITY_DN6097_c0_g1_i1.p1  ORF type:complete len:526 (-),score=203.93 TRINITY_DN6097_c0_g1_i1:203-1780(-)